MNTERIHLSKGSHRLVVFIVEECSSIQVKAEHNVIECGITRRVKETFDVSMPYEIT